MAKSTVGLVALTAVSLATLCEGGAFLDARVHTKDGQVSREDMEAAMAQFSADVGMSEYLSEVETEFRPMYAALPKNQFGNLEPATVRYALHRYFVQKHGWWMMGLESGSVSNTSGQTMILAERAPAVIHAMLEERQHGQGMGLREVAIFASVLTSLISTEVAVSMHGIWEASQLPMNQSVDSVSADNVVKSYMMFYIIEETMTSSYFNHLDKVEKAVRNVYPAWDDTAMWVDDFRHTEEFNGRSRSNPFKKPVATFESTVAFAQEVTHHFSLYQKLECATLKHGLLELEHQGTGRVLLSRFYAGALGGDWTFGESPAYLRNLGALDESDPAKPVVLIPNYVTSKTNCLVGSGFYSLCCADECENLFRHIEAKVAAPSADPSQLASIVASLPSDTVDAPRNLSSVLLDRLGHIADMHKGSVPLHGRMFAQWMHHAYPRECSQPKDQNRAEPVLVVKDWLAKHGQDSLEATEEQMQVFVGKSVTEGSEPVFLPWSTEEQLVAEDYVAKGAEPWSLMSIRTFAAFAVLLSFAGAVVQAGAAGRGESIKAESLMV